MLREMNRVIMAALTLNRTAAQKKVLLAYHTVKTTTMKGPPFIALSAIVLLAWEAKLEANNEGVSKGGQCHEVISCPQILDKLKKAEPLWDDIRV